VSDRPLSPADRDRFSAIAHAQLPFCHPLSASKVEAILGCVTIPVGGSVLDLACGRGEILIRLSGRQRIVGLGIDRSEPMVTAARQNLRVTGIATGLRFELADAVGFQAPDGFYDLVVCTGASTLFGDQTRTLDRVARYARPGGQVLFGAAYWRAQPTAALLELMGVEPDVLADYEATIAAAELLGLVSLYAAVSSLDEWDHYEWTYRYTMDRYLADHPDDSAAAEFAALNRRGRDMYLRGGRKALGFGLFLYRK
jgi:ubiquinone/menaquinone biosynthesis C-methylase UbiE